MAEVAEPRPRQIVIKSWHVVSVPDTVKPEDLKKAKPIRQSAEFVVRDAAEEFARLLRKWAKYPQTVEVRARQGYDDL